MFNNISLSYFLFPSLHIDVNAMQIIVVIAIAVIFISLPPSIY
nr:MAG TPA: hypothetical protein [Caudoviricetes sp.]